MITSPANPRPGIAALPCRVLLLVPKGWPAETTGYALERAREAFGHLYPENLHAGMGFAASGDDFLTNCPYNGNTHDWATWRASVLAFYHQLIVICDPAEGYRLGEGNAALVSDALMQNRYVWALGDGDQRVLEGRVMDVARDPAVQNMRMNCVLTVTPWGPG